MPKIIQLSASASTPIAPPLSFQLPKNGRCKVLSVQITLTTDANLGGRLVFVQIAARGFLLHQSFATYSHTPSKTTAYTFAVGQSHQRDVNDDRCIAPLPDVWLPDEPTLNVFTDNPQATDAWANATATIEVEE